MVAAEIIWRIFFCIQSNIHTQHTWKWSILAAGAPEILWRILVAFAVLCALTAIENDIFQQFLGPNIHVVVSVTQQLLILWYYPAMFWNPQNMSEHSSLQCKMYGSSVTFWFIKKNIAWPPIFSTLILEFQAENILFLYRFSVHVPQATNNIPWTISPPRATEVLHFRVY